MTKQCIIRVENENEKPAREKENIMQGSENDEVKRKNDCARNRHWLILTASQPVLSYLITYS